MVRSFVRKWLGLPKDVPNAYFHAQVRAGGLGISSIRWTSPRLRVSRIDKVSNDVVSTNGVQGNFLRDERMRSVRQLTIGGSYVGTKASCNTYLRDALHSTFDGCGLREAHKVAPANDFMGHPGKLLSGRDYRNLARLRINALPCRSRTARGRPRLDRLCRAGCQATETMNHVSGTCKRAYAPRIERHDSVNSYLAECISKRGHRVEVETRLVTEDQVG